MTEAQQRYRVVEKLESGGMAEVFRAESEGLQGFRKQVAIKRVLPHLTEKKRFIAMFLDEARLSAQLSHSNCVQVFDIGVGDNAFFIVMEYVDGANLKGISEWVQKQGKDFPVQAAAWIAHEICKGLSYAHDLTDPNGMPMNLVHRDMSPPNVLVTKYGEVKIVDFGLAKASSQLEKSEPGIIKGKFSYLSPEAALGQEVDKRTDIFAVGIILWELLAGQRLFLGDTDFQTVKKVQLAQVPAISQINRKVPPELERIVNRALAREMHARYGTARELGQDLSRFMFSFGQPISSYDLAAIVQGAMREKQQRVRAPQGSIIDKLIEEALYEFTSLKEDGGPASGNMSVVEAAPLNTDGFVDPPNWANEIAIGEVKRPGFDPLRASLPPGVFEQGNLSALEDAEPVPVSSGTRSPRQPAPPSVGALPPQSSPVGPAPSQRNLAPRPSNPGPGLPATAAIGLVVVLAVAAAGAAAWFTRLIPHP